MSMTQTMIGGTALILVGTMILDVVTPDPEAIIVHDLSYDEGFILQDRTVIAVGADGTFYAHWAARFEYAETGKNVPNCSGNGAWSYEVGRSIMPIPYREWVGNGRCELEPGVEYVPIASWSWGANQTSFVGESFVIEGEVE